MSKPKQSPVDRLHRLQRGNCPVHGVGMSQVGLMPIRGRVLTEVKCDRRDCDIRGTQAVAGQEVTLLPKYEHLLA